MSRTSSWKRWPGWLALFLVVAGLLTYGALKDSGPLTPEQRVEEITKRIACPVCDGETVYESANPSSVAIRAEVKAQVAQGQNSDDEIVAFIVQQFGAQTQLVPNATGFDSLVWILPAVALVCAGVGLFFAFRKWKHNVDAVPDDEDRARVAAALAEDDAPSTAEESTAEESTAEEPPAEESPADEGGDES